MSNPTAEEFKKLQECRDLEETDWDEVFPAVQYAFGRAGFVQFDNFNDAKNEALLYHDIEYIGEYKGKYSLSYRKVVENYYLSPRGVSGEINLACKEMGVFLGV